MNEASVVVQKFGWTKRKRFTKLIFFFSYFDAFQPLSSPFVSNWFFTNFQSLQIWRNRSDMVVKMPEKLFLRMKNIGRCKKNSTKKVGLFHCNPFLSLLLIWHVSTFALSVVVVFFLLPNFQIIYLFIHSCWLTDCGARTFYATSINQ